MKEIKKKFTDELSNCGFNRKKDWYYRNDDLIMVINIQQSNYDKSYFINVGVWINAINNEIEFPKENKCHLRFRAERLLPNVLNDSNLRGIFSLEKEDKLRLKKIELFIRDYFCPLLNKFKEIDTIKLMYKNNKLSGAYVYKDLKSLLMN